MATAKVIIVVCVSNSCRSPMAEYLLRHEIVKGKEGGSISGNYLVISRALSSDYEPEGSPASAQGVTVNLRI